MFNYEPSEQELHNNNKEFVPKEHFLFEVPKDIDELKTRLISALDNKRVGWSHLQSVETSQYLYDFLGENTRKVPLSDVVGWTLDKSVVELLNEVRGDSRGINHILEIINGWKGDGDDSHQKLNVDGLTFISNEPGKYILNEGKHRFLAAIAMGISEIPAKVDLYSRK